MFQLRCKVQAIYIDIYLHLSEKNMPKTLAI